MSSNRVRIDKYLADMGIGTRREIKQFVRLGHVRLNGEVVSDPGTQVVPGADRVTYLDEAIAYQKWHYLMLNKPQGVITATRDKRAKTVLDLIPAQYGHAALFPVGRLDKDTEGLLLLTNDGKLGHALTSPRRMVAKTYEADIDGSISAEDILAFERGVTLDDGYVTLPAGMKIVHESKDGLCRVHITVYEGKFHQVKRMVRAVGKEVVHLKRLTMGPLALDPALPAGACRPLTQAEIGALQLLRER